MTRALVEEVRRGQAAGGRRAPGPPLGPRCRRHSRGRRARSAAALAAEAEEALGALGAKHSPPTRRVA